MSVPTRPLTGCAVGLSISEGQETAALGFTAAEVNRTTLRIVAALVGQGAAIVFGHDWRDDGVMDSVHSFVERFEVPFTARTRRAPLTNLVVWPDKPRLAGPERRRLQRTLAVEEAGLPPALSEYRNDRDPTRYAYLRSRALTHLRHRLTHLSNARICLGGKLSGYSGRYPGIVEEAYLAVRADQPTFISGALGGAASQIVKALEQVNSPTDLCPEAPVTRFYTERSIDEPGSEDPDDLQWSSEAVWRAFASLGVPGLSAKNKLSVDENQQLFTTQSVDQAIELILTGLGRLNQERE